jgi:exodeoxyribonuclease VII large subunit
MNKNVYTVGQVNHYIKNMFQEDFLLRQISVKGEVSNCKYHTSGHIYFTLKDATGAMSAMMFSGDRRMGLAFPMKDGDQVIVTGGISVYERGGTYQLYAKKVTLDGAGDLHVRFERLKKELEEMGMFSPEYKKPIPKYARRVGIVTAPTGAAVRDIIQISKRRNPYVELVLYPAQVQGEGAVESIISGIYALDALDLDVLIVGRGGGSIEDLWAFNEEAVARAVFACNTPVISAVGHETDTTICDYVADMRAPTPSAAAELAVFSYEEFENELSRYAFKLSREMEIKCTGIQQRITGYARELEHASPVHRLKEKRQYAENLTQRLQSDMQWVLGQKRSAMAILAGRLDGASPAKKLSQGYGFVTDAEGRHISGVSQVKEGDDLHLYLQDGKLITTIKEIDEDKTWNKQ